jgi:PAN domain
VNWSKSLTPQIQSLQHGEGYFFFTPVVPVGLPLSAATSQIPEQKGPSEVEARNRSVVLAEQAAEAEQQRLAALKAEQDHKAKSEAEEAAADAPDRVPMVPPVLPGTPVPTVTGLFAVRNGAYAYGEQIGQSTLVKYAGECEQACARVAICKVFAYSNRTDVCRLHTSVDSFWDSTEWDLGVRVRSSLSRK